jgi:hypothetical protein
MNSNAIFFICNWVKIGMDLLQTNNILINHYNTLDQDSSVSIATDYGLDGRNSIPGTAKFFSSPQRPNRLLSSPSLYPMGTGGSFPVGKAAGRETDHSPPSSTEVKKGGAMPPLLYMSSRNNFTFTLD